MILSGFGLAQAPTLDDVFKHEIDLHFDDLYPRRSHLGSSANVQGWSHDDRYLAYFWNPYREQGDDLYIYDSRSGKSERLTDVEKMAKFDGDAIDRKSVV